MALDVYTGEFALDTTIGGGSQAVTGVGFTPKALILFTTGLNSGSGSGAFMNRVLGVAVSGAEGSIEAANYDGSAKGATTSYRAHSEGSVYWVPNQSTTGALEDFSVASLDADGFTLTKTAVSGARNVKFLALGGSDITGAAIKHFQTNTSTGSQGYTGVGFQPDCTIFLGNAANVSSGLEVRNTPQLFGMGVALSSTERWAIGGSADSANPGQACRVLDTAKAFNLPYQDADYLAFDFVSHDADGFTIDYTTAPGNARYMTALCLAGPAFAVGTDTARTTTGTKTTATTGVDPAALLLAAHNSTTLDSVINGDDALSLGVGVSSTSRRGMWSGTDDASGASFSSSRAHTNSSVLIEYTENSATPALVREADIDSLGSAGFTLDWATVDGTAGAFAFLAIGTAAATDLVVQPDPADVDVDTAGQAIATNPTVSPVPVDVDVDTSGQAVTFTTATVDAMWCGAVTPTGFDVVAVLSDAAAAARLEVATDSGFTGIVFTSSPAATSTLAGAGEVVKLQATGLTADTAYYYRITFAGDAINTVGQVRTAPAAGTAKSFSVAIGSCSNHVSLTPNTDLWNIIAASGAAMFVHLGDLHYGDNTAADAQSVYRADLLTHMQLSKAAAMYRALPMAYVYDDHDFGPNDNEIGTTGFGTFAARTITAYTDLVPHYPQAQPSGTGAHVRGITQAWDWGRVRFIMPDLRAFASVGDTLLGDGGTYHSLVTWDQEAWIAAQVSAAAADVAAGDIALVVLLSSRTWNQDSDDFDSWEEHWATYQAAFAESLADNGIPALIVCGDGHQTGFDDGLDDDFTGGKGQLPNIMASPLNNTAFTTTGPYEWQGVATERPASGTAEHHQFVLLTVTDDGTTLTWQAEAFDETGASVLGPVASDDDTPELNFVSASYAPAENGGTVTLTVEKDWFSPCSVQWATADGTAVAGLDYTAGSGTLSWPGVGALQTIEITIADRAGWQGPRSFTVTLSDPSGATLGATATATVTIQDDEECLVQPAAADVDVLVAMAGGLTGGENPRALHLAVTRPVHGSLMGLH